MEPVKAPAPLVIISSSPYIHCGSTISAAMRDVLLSLLPALAAAVYFFGWPALSVILTCCLSAVICEALCQKLMQRPITVGDGSALLIRPAAGILPAARIITGSGCLRQLLCCRYR